MIVPTPQEVGRQVACFFLDLSGNGSGYLFEASSNVGTQERWMGENGLGRIELIGPPTNLLDITFLGAVADTASAIKHTETMLRILNVVFPDWTERLEWLKKAINGLPTHPEQVTVRNGAVIKLSKVSMLNGIMLSVDSRKP